MRHECSIRLIDLGDWVYDTATGWDDLPIYRLASPRDLFASDEIIGKFREVGLTTTRRRPDSGVIESWVTRENNTTVISAPLIQMAIATAVSEDSREYQSDVEVNALGGTTSERQFISFHSRIKSDIPSDSRTESGTPVIGPGGKVSIFRTSTSTVVDITVRKRVGKLPSRWRRFQNIYRTYLREFAPWKKQIEVEPMLGYFELSKYEPQLFLRLAFVFIFSMTQNEDNANEDNAVSWQTIRVEPATESPEIPRSAGLGQWLSSGGTQ
jgi:hypothetical protein